MKKIKLIIPILILLSYTASAQWSIDSISIPYNGLTSTLNGSKAIFASNVKYEIYDFTNGSWATHNMLQPRPAVKVATSGTKSYFGGGGYITVNTYNFYKNVDIYNSSNNTWTTTNLSQARIVGAAASVGNKILFAGGRQILNYSNRVDIFDITTGIRTTHNLSQARHNMAVAVVGTKVIFAGGECGNISMGIYSASNKVDIYDDATGLWSTAILTSNRELITAAVVGTKALFAGGRNPNGVYQKHIDIYDIATNVWTTKNLSEPKYGMSAITVGNKVYFAGGTINNSGALSSKVEIYNATYNSKTVVSISSPRMGMAVGITPDRIMFAGGIVTWGNVATNRVEVLNLITNTWSVEYLSRPRLNLASVSYGNQVLFAGGAEVLSSYPQYSIISNRVDIWSDPLLSPTQTGRDVINKYQEQLHAYIYPNPFQEKLNVNISDLQIPATVLIYDLTGKQMNSFQIVSEKSEFDFSYLKNGIYNLRIQQYNKNDQVIRIIKE